MQYEILGRPDFALLKVKLEQVGERVVAESGAMVTMTSGVSMATAARGGFAAAAKRSLLGGESFFQNTFEATVPGQEVWLAPGSEGDIAARVLAPGEHFFLQSGCYLAHAGSELVLDTKWGGVKGFFSGVGMFMIRLTGPGLVFYATYGAVREVSLVPGRALTVDTGHIVGFTDKVSYRVRSFAGLKGFFFSGEGLVADFDGEGTVYLQTRNPTSLATFLQPYRRTSS